MPRQNFEEYSDQFGRYARDFFSPYFNDEDDDISPQVKVRETQKRYALSVELPDISPEDIFLSFKNHNLIISVHSSSDSEYANFFQNVPLMEEVDSANIEAHFGQGMLHIVIPKNENGHSTNVTQIPIRRVGQA